MRIDIPAPDAWGKLSERYRAHLPTSLQDPSLNIAIFNGTSHAVTEVAKSLSQLYTHKKTIAIVTQVDPSFEAVAVSFSQDEFQVKLVTPKQAEDVATWTPIMDELLFVLTSVDDPITGKLTNLRALDEACKGKRVFRLLVSHQAHLHDAATRPEPFVAKIFSLSADRALFIGGERCKIQPLFAPSLNWTSDSDEEIGASLSAFHQLAGDDFQSKVESFEAKLPSGFRPYFRAGEPRIFDRALFYHPELDGLAVIEELSTTLRTPLAPLGKKSQLETTSACRWESPKFQEWLSLRGEAAESIRGLVIVSAELIDQGLATHLETAAKKIERMQRGS